MQFKIPSHHWIIYSNTFCSVWYLKLQILQKLFKHFPYLTNISYTIAFLTYTLCLNPFTLLALLLNATHKNIKGIFKITGLKTTDLTFKYQNGLNEMTCSSMTITEICPLTTSAAVIMYSHQVHCVLNFKITKSWWKRRKAYPNCLKVLKNVKLTSL